MPQMQGDQEARREEEEKSSIKKDIKVVTFLSLTFFELSLLLSSFSGATEAMNLQLATIVSLDETMRGMKALYKFSVIPYFESFWKQKLITNAIEFMGKEHLRLKGFTLIETATWDKKISTIFRVFSNHLNITLTTAASDFLDC